jgi:uncharacterized protein involved in type VI secretion and phage assembly
MLAHPPAAFRTPGLELAEVVSVDDPEGLNRVEVKFLSRADAATDAATAWAPVAAGFTGDGAGAFFIPDNGTRVAVSFVNGDLRYPIVLGALWDGGTASPETLPGDAVDRWSFTGKAGTRIAIVEESNQPVISLTTPGGASLKIEDAGGGKLTARAGGATVTLSGSGVTVQTGGTVKVEGSMMQLKSSLMTVDTPFAQFSGIVQVQTLLATTVVSSTYTPGVGNIW